MDERPRQLVKLLNLKPHPEGGYYAEIFRSPREVQPGDLPAPRSAMTTMYFLLTAGSHSRWHRIASDEVWHFLEGDPLELLSIHRAGTTCARSALGPTAGEHRPVEVVPAGSWQAARTEGAYTLVGCTVGPGFDFADFELLVDHPDQAESITKQFPALADLI